MKKILIFLFCFSSQALAEEALIINKENLTKTQKIQETQAYIDLVWSAYNYRKSAFPLKKVPAATPYLNVALPSPAKSNSSKSSAVKTPASQVAEAKAEVSTPSSKSTAQASINPTKPASTVENKMTEHFVQVEKDAIPTNAISQDQATSSSQKTDKQLANQATSVGTNNEVIGAVENDTTIAEKNGLPQSVALEPKVSKPNATQAGNRDLNKALGEIKVENPRDVVDADSRPPYESFVSDIGQEVAL